MADSQQAGVFGRSLRLLDGIGIMAIALPVFFRAGWAYNLRSLAIVLGLAAFYTLVHWAVSRYVPDLNRWIGSVLAVAAAFAVWFFGQVGGPLFGQGEGRD